MPASMTGITRDTPLGATLVHGGAAFRVWAPAARQVFVLTGTALRAAEQAGLRTLAGRSHGPPRRWHMGRFRA